MSSKLVEWFLKEKALSILNENIEKSQQKLDLSELNIIVFPTCPDLFLSNHFFREIYLQKNLLSELPNNFGHVFSHLEKLAIDDNLLISLPASIELLDNLTFLNISHNSFSTNRFPEETFVILSLKKLWANGIGISTIPEEIQFLTNLRVLGLRNNNLRKIPDCLTSLINIEWLTLENNNIKDFPKNLTKLEKLKHLNLNCNRISHLPNIWYQFPKLACVFLRHNEITVSSSVINALQRLPKMKYIDLFGNPRWSNRPFRGFLHCRAKKPVEIEIIWTTDSIQKSNDNESCSGSSEDEELMQILGEIKDNERVVSNNSIIITATDTRTYSCIKSACPSDDSNSDSSSISSTKLSNDTVVEVDPDDMIRSMPNMYCLSTPTEKFELQKLNERKEHALESFFQPTQSQDATLIPLGRKSSITERKIIFTLDCGLENEFDSEIMLGENNEASFSNESLLKDSTISASTVIVNENNENMRLDLSFVGLDAEVDAEDQVTDIDYWSESDNTSDIDGIEAQDTFEDIHDQEDVIFNISQAFNLIVKSFLF